MDHDAHDYEKRLKTQLRKLKEDLSISDENRKLILSFIDHAYASGITTGRVVRYLFDLRVWARLIGKSFEKADKEDIQVIVGKIEKENHYAKSTIRDLKLTLRKFYKWLRKTDEFPDEVKWYKTHIKYTAIKNPEEMLTEEEVRSMIETCRNPRDRAFISALYESGCRIGEILLLRMNQIKFDKYGALLLVNGKTGFRRVRIVSSAPYLTEWINKHPSKDDPNAHVWVNCRMKRVGYNSTYGILRRIADKAGIKKKVNPHNFRHSRASHLANHLTEAQMKEYFGWVQGSDMASIYVHLSGRDVDNALLKVYGIKNDEERRASVLKPKTCERCAEANQATNKFCHKCGFPLDPETKADVLSKELDRKEADRVLDSLLDDDEFREMFVRKVAKLSSKCQSI